MQRLTWKFDRDHQLAEFVTSTDSWPSFILSPIETGNGGSTPSIQAQNGSTGGSEIESCLQIHSKFKITLGYVRPV